MAPEEIVTPEVATEEVVAEPTIEPTNEAPVQENTEAIIREDAVSKENPIG